MPTPTPQQAFDAELKRRQRALAETQLATEQAVVAELEAARAAILAKLAEQPTDFEQWRLPQLLAQIETLLDGALARMASATDLGLRNAWQHGEDLVDKPLGAGGIQVEHRLPLLDVRTLNALRTFTAGRLQDVTREALGKINQQLGLVLVGAQAPFAAIKVVQAQLGLQSPRRAITIVRTSVGGAQALAKQQRMEQAAALMAESGQVLEKQWRRSGKIHSRWNHDVIDGQRVPVTEPFKVPTLGGGVIEMMHPHDPTAPAEEVINCGCTVLPRVKGWAVATPGAKPFTALELKLDGGKAQLDRMAKARGFRREGGDNGVMTPHPQALANADRAVIPLEKVTGYALNVDHPDGMHKARVFKSALGITAENHTLLLDQIRAGLPFAAAKVKVKDDFGQRYEVDVPVTGPGGSGIVKTAWIVDPGGVIPRLISVYMRS